MNQVIIDMNLVKHMWRRAEKLVALPEDGVQHTETCRRNVVNIFYIYMHLLGTLEDFLSTDLIQCSRAK